MKPTMEFGETSLIAHEELAAILEQARGDHGVPGAAVGVMSPASDGRLMLDAAWSGVVNQSTGYPVIRDTLFQIGSLTKIWTTVLAMQLIDEHRLALGTRVKDILPNFRIDGSPEITYGCTIRDLMCHISGIEGDAFPDTLGRGDDCIAAYVDYIAQYPPRTPLGGPLSYSNGAFVILGRVVEVLRGMTWDAALRKYIADPAGFDHVWTLPEDVLRYSSALGHHRAVPIDDVVFPAPVKPTTTWQLPRCTGPCGQISASIADLMSFASIFLSGGIAPNGARLLSAEGIDTMLTQQVDLRDQGIGNLGWALGWQMPNWGDTRAFGHGGATEGQRATIVIFPDHKIALAVLTNADAGTQMAGNIIGRIAAQAGIGPRPNVALAKGHISETAKRDILGTYEKPGEHMVFRSGGSTGVEVVIDPDEDDGPNGVRLVLPLYRTTHGFYAIQRPDSLEPTEIAFVASRNGTRYVASGHRVTPRVSR